MLSPALDDEDLILDDMDEMEARMNTNLQRKNPRKQELVLKPTLEGFPTLRVTSRNTAPSIKVAADYELKVVTRNNLREVKSVFKDESGDWMYEPRSDDELMARHKRFLDRKKSASVE